MNSETEKQKLWEWCGFIWQKWGQWISPDGVKSCLLPDLTLDNLFKWAVPKLEACDEDSLKPTHPCWISLRNYSGHAHWTCSIQPELYEGYEGYEASADTPAMAFCLALEKLIASQATLKGVGELPQGVKERGIVQGKTYQDGGHY